MSIGIHLLNCSDILEISVVRGAGPAFAAPPADEQTGRGLAAGMEVRMEYTEGLGRAAEVWVDGRLLNVCDAVSRTAKRCPPGVLTGAAFQYVTVEGFTWEQAVRANPDRKRTLTPLRGWSYTGYGQVVQIMPVIVDFGFLRMADANWTYDERLVGRYVRIDIDRLEIAWSSPPDWPEDAR